MSQVVEQHSHQAEQTPAEEPPSYPLTIFRGIIGRCPHCGKGKLFKGYLHPRPSCSVCGQDFTGIDSADGPAVFVMLITGFAIVGGALWVELEFHPPYWVHAVIWGPLAIILPLALLRPLKGIFMAVQFRYQAAEGRLEGHHDAQE